MRLSIVLIMFVVFFTSSLHANDQALPEGARGCFGTIKAQILKVYAAEDNGARFRAYHVKWLNHDIVVSDMFGTTDYKEGDTITFLSQNIEIPAGNKVIRALQFTIIDARPFE